MLDKGFFGGLFDFDNDGKLDSLEITADFMAFNEMLNDNEQDEFTLARLDIDGLEYIDEENE